MSNVLDGLKPTGLIIDGVLVPCRAPVFNWRDTGLETKIGGHNKKRAETQLIDIFVVHWTGGYGDAEAMFGTLGRRKLGVEFFFDYDGKIVQFCDPELVNSADAGYLNPRSLGAEFRCGGYPSPGRIRKDQPVYRDSLRGRGREFVSFSTAQHESLLALLEALHEADLPRIKIPLQVPTDKGGAVLTRTMTGPELAAFKGVVGHYHISDNKADPGPRPMIQLDAAFRARAA